MQGSKVPFLTEVMPLPEPEKLERMVTGELPNDGIKFDIVPVKKYFCLPVSLVLACKEPASNRVGMRSGTTLRKAVEPVTVNCTWLYATVERPPAAARRIMEVLSFMIISILVWVELKFRLTRFWSTIHFTIGLAAAVASISL